METVFGQVGVVALTCNTLSAAVILSGQLHQSSLMGTFGLAILAATQVAMLTALLSPTAPITPIGCTVATVAGIVAAESGMVLDRMSAAHTWWPLHALFNVSAFVALRERRRRGVLILSAIGIAVLILRTASWDEWPLPPEFLRQMALELGQWGLIAASTVLLIAIMSDMARNVDRSLGRRHESRLARQRSLNDTARERTVDQFLHDEVLHALRALATPSGMPACDLRRVAADVADRLTIPTAPQLIDCPPDRLRDRIVDVARASGLHVKISTTGGVEVALPSEVADAFTGAVTEALRNVERHAGVREATIRIQRRGLEIRVTVVDKGVGFLPAARGRRHGIDVSMRERLAEVGGRAVVESVRGGGTRAVFTWSPFDAAPAVRLRQAAMWAVSPDIYRRATLIVLPALANVAWCAAWSASATTAPMAVAGASLAVVGIGLMTGRLSENGLSGAWSALLTAVAWAASVTGGLALPVGQNDAYGYWLAGGAGTLVLYQCLFRPIGEGLLTGLGLAVIAVIATWHAAVGVSWTPYLPCVLSPLIPTLIGAILRIGMDRMVVGILHAQDVAARARGREQRLAAVRLSIAMRVRQRHEAVYGFLTDVADGRLDPGEPAVRRRADELERSVRETLMLAGGTGLRTAIARSRGHGIQVSFRSVARPPRAVAYLASRLLDVITDECAVLPAQASDAELTLSIGGSALSGWRISAYVTTSHRGAHQAMTARARAYGWNVRTDEDGTLIVIHAPRGDADTAPQGTTHGGEVAACSAQHQLPGPRLTTSVRGGS